MACDSSSLLSPGVGWRIARILVDREARVNAVVTVLSRSRRRVDFGFDFASYRSALPDDLKPPVVAAHNAVIDPRCSTVSDHFVSGALGIVARREACSSGVHRFLLLKTTTHMLGVPPKSSGGATDRCVMSRLTICAAPGLFQTGIEAGVPSPVCPSDVGASSARRPRSGDRS